MSRITHPTARSRGEADRAEPALSPKLRPTGGHDFDSEDSYAAKQRAHDARYRREYQAWVASLPPEERRQLAAMGLEEPQMPHTSASGHCDAAELARCAALPEAVDHDDEEPAAGMYPQFSDTEAARDMLRVFVGELMSRDNMRLSVECLALVTGLCYTGESMTTIARRHSVTRAAVSKRCVEFTQALRLAPCRAMRTLKARQSYRRSRIKQIHEHP